MLQQGPGDNPLANRGRGEPAVIIAGNPLIAIEQDSPPIILASQPAAIALAAQFFQEEMRRVLLDDPTLKSDLSLLNDLFDHGTWPNAVKQNTFPADFRINSFQKNDFLERLTAAISRGKKELKFSLHLDHNSSFHKFLDPCNASRPTNRMIKKEQERGLFRFSLADLHANLHALVEHVLPPTVLTTRDVGVIGESGINALMTTLYSGRKDLSAQIGYLPFRPNQNHDVTKGIPSERPDCALVVAGALLAARRTYIPPSSSGTILMVAEEHGIRVSRSTIDRGVKYFDTICTPDSNGIKVHTHFIEHINFGGKSNGPDSVLLHSPVASTA